MTAQRPIEIVRKFCPKARAEYLAAFEAGDGLFRRDGITTAERLEHFLAQVLHESGALTVTTENMNYRAERIREVWPSRPEAVKFAGKPEALGNSVYANRMGNGPPESGDGYRYRGRGLMQTTGKNAYRRYAKLCGVDFLADPDLICDARYALLPALAEWKEIGGNDLADRGDIRTITYKINGGYTGYTERVAWLHRLEKAVGDITLDVAAPIPDHVPVTKPSTAPATGKKGVFASIGLMLSGMAAYVSGHPWAIGLSVVGALAAAGIVVYLERKGSK